jgi:alpha-D-xyloside xylohydrolase
MGTDWINFWNGKKYTGGQTFPVEAPLGEIPLFVRAGSILPMGPFIQHAAESADPVELRIYPGADGRFVLYEDENDNYNYEKGEYATIEFNWDDAGRKLTVEDRQGEFSGMLETRTFRVVLVDTENGTGVNPAENPSGAIEYDGKKTVLGF